MGCRQGLDRIWQAELPVAALRAQRGADLPGYPPKDDSWLAAAVPRVFLYIGRNTSGGRLKLLQFGAYSARGRGGGGGVAGRRVGCRRAR